MIVTTLPVTPGKHNSFVTLFGPLIADIFSKLTSHPFKMILNTVHSFSSFDHCIDHYIDQLKHIDVKPIIEYDNCKNYQKLVEDTIGELVGDGLLVVEKSDIIHCQCGVVDLPVSVYSVLYKQCRYKYIQQNKCVRCGSELITERENVVKLQLPKTEPNIRLSHLYKGRFYSAYRSLEERPIIISRNHRDGFSVILDGHLFKLDTDFCWMVYLFFIYDKELGIISGSDTINHSAKVIKLLDVYKPNTKINLIIHPLLRPLDGKIKLSRFTVDDYLNYCKTPQFARTFLSLGAQWHQPEVSIQASNLHLVEKSIYPKQIFCPRDNILITPITPMDFYRVFNSNKILGLLKAMRKYQIDLDIQQVVLKNALLG